MTKRIGIDILLWIISLVCCLVWRFAADKSEVWAYIVLAAILMASWIAVGLLVQLYRNYRKAWYWQSMLSLAVTTTVLMLGAHYLLPKTPLPVSVNVATWLIGIVAGIDVLVILMEHYWKYATNMTVPVMQIEERANAAVTHKDAPRSEKSMETVHRAITSLTTEEDYCMLLERAGLGSRLTKVVADRDRFAILQLPEYEYNCIVDMTLLNDARGINKRFCLVNKKLPDNGRYVCCYRPQEYIKQKMLRKYPAGLNWCVYSLYFFWKRVVPRLMLTSRLYYDTTKGRKRMLSKTEVLGRLYYCGFEVDEIVPMGHIEYVFCHRHMQPYPQQQLKVYGPLIKLRRVGKNKKFVYFYKVRTMHPYAEYIQKYVFDQRGGMNIADKSDDDWRITSWGKIMRKYWLDELPMLINWVKRDVKLVGVRPLSKTMFETYPKWLQDKRTKTKPGLIPPFYIDHPKTFEELYASEDKYLTEYLKHPVWTDIKYFFMTMHSILFRRMHSA
ncbi:MAG: sugar transferase [Paludibacteraceae bacterium]|nr:sugar transferase [Paludibacteraceae bacterium]